MRRRVLAVLLVGFLVMQNSSILVLAEKVIGQNDIIEETEVVETEDNNNVTVVKSGECGRSATYTITSDGVLTIQSDYDTGDYDHFSYSSLSPFKDNKDISKVVFLGNMTRIGAYLLDGCSNIDTIVWPSKLKEIGRNAFQCCDGLTELNFPNTLTTIGNGAFCGCNGLTSIRLLSTITSLEANAFSDCHNLSDITLPTSLKVIKERVFSGCPIKSIIIPDSVIMIDDRAFYMCDQLESIILSNNLQIIGEGAFSTCRALKNISLPTTLTRIDDKAFFNCDSLERIDVSQNCNSIGEYAFGYYYDATGAGYTKKATFVLGCVENSKAHAYAQMYAVSYELQQPWITEILFSSNIIFAVLGEEIDLGMKISPSNYCEKYTYISSNENAVKVNDNTLLAVGIGYSSVSVKTEHGKNYTVYVTVIDNNISNFDIDLEYENITYSGKENKPKIVINNGVNSLSEKVDYELEYSNNIDAGYATVTIKGINKYVGQAEKVFEITQLPITEDLIKVDLDSVVYKGEPVVKDVELCISDKILKENVDYVIRYLNNDSIGTASIIISGINNCTESVIKSFDIRKAAEGKYALLKKCILKHGLVDANGNRYFNFDDVQAEGRTISSIKYLERLGKFEFVLNSQSKSGTTGIKMLMDENGSQTVTAEYYFEEVSLNARSLFDAKSYTPNSNVYFEKSSNNVLDNSQIQNLCNSTLRSAFDTWDIILLNNLGFDVNMADLGFIGYEEKGTHTYDEWQVNKKPTCSENGEKTRICIVCGESEKEIIPANEHKWNGWTISSEATVFEPATQKSTCSVCKKIKTRKFGSKLKSKLSINANTVTMKKNQSTSALKVSGMANGDYVRNVKSGKLNIVKVTGFSKNGTIKLKAQKKTGTAKLMITLAGGGKKTIIVKVQSSTIRTERISGISKKLVLKKGKKITLKPVVIPFTSQEKVTYSTSNGKVVIVSSRGVVTAKKKGIATVTLKSGSKKVTCVVQVK